MNVPNLLSISRILAVPVFIVLMLEPTPERALWAGVVFALASITDWFDGYYARKWDQITKIGKLLDPLADKILIASALIVLLNTDPDLVPAWMVIIIVGREIAVTGLRAKAAAEGIIIAADTLGKYKVGAQITAVLSFVLVHAVGGALLVLLGTATLWISVLLALLSGGQYFITYWRKLG
jgi:CDP-diacylglycerol--glycerol-3-phosphate 3-phosphatidyltransferase